MSTDYSMKTMISRVVHERFFGAQHAVLAKTLHLLQVDFVTQTAA
mgnify:CR=1 FL=1